MKIIKYLLAFILLVVAVLLIAGLFMKKEMDVEREITINKPKDQVFNYIKYLKNQDYYSKWMKMDPNMKHEYVGTDGTVGFTAKWESDNNKVGKGEQTITKIVEGDRIESKLHFIKPREGQCDAFMSTEAAGPNATKVKWHFHSPMPYPFNTMQLFMDMDKMIGDDFMTGLTNLKEILEKQ